MHPAHSRFSEHQIIGMASPQRHMAARQFKFIVHAVTLRSEGDEPGDVCAHCFGFPLGLLITAQLGPRLRPWRYCSVTSCCRRGLGQQ